MKRTAKTRKVSRRRQSIELRSGALLEILITSKPTLLCVVRGAVERLAESLGFPDAQARSITLAVDEAITNIIRHSYGGRENRPIAIYFRKMQHHSRGAAENGLEILLHDRGPAVDTAKLCGRDLNDVKPGGLGLHFIEECMDNVQYARVGKINQWKLRKFIQTAKEEQQS
jgi:serine/threonine-protein kinase RsbW